MSRAILFHFLCTEHVADINISTTCWVHKKWNRIARDIKLVFYSSTILQINNSPVHPFYKTPSHKLKWCGYNFDVCYLIVTGMSRKTDFKT